MKQNSVKENSTMSERLPYLYVEHAIIEQCDSSVQILQGKDRIPLPVAALGCLVLGPGCSITHRAIEAMCDSGCLLVWSGEHLRTWYARKSKFCKFIKTGRILCGSCEAYGRGTVDVQQTVRWGDAG